MQWDEHGGRITDHKSDPRPVIHSGRKSDAESDARTAQNREQQAFATLRQESQNGIETDESTGVITVLPNKTAIVYKRTVGEEGLEPPLYHSGNMAFLSQDDAESDARFAELETLIENWSLLTTDDRRRIIAIVNGRLA